MAGGKESLQAYSKFLIMAGIMFIIQGEGKGHLSQALALDEYLATAGHRVEKVLVGSKDTEAVLPAYFKEHFHGRLDSFRSPGFIKSPNRKGIRVARTMGRHFLRLPLYLKEIYHVRRLILETGPDLIFNFYELVGALAMRKAGSPGGGMQPLRVSIGHHFYHHLRGYRSADRGFPFSFLHAFLLKTHTHLVLRGCDQAWALSLEPGKGKGKIEVLPPLVRASFRRMSYSPGERYLAYVLNEGYIYDLLRVARTDPDFQMDVFCSELPEDLDLPPGMLLHEPDAEKFSIFMASCKALVTTAGFEAVAEAAMHGIPVGVIPVQGHFEQYCNAADVQEKGLGTWMKSLNRDSLEALDSQMMKAADLRSWIKEAWEEKIDRI